MAQAFELIIEKLFTSVWNQGKLEVLDEIAAPDITLHFSTGPIKGVQNFKEIIATWRSAFPDLKHDIDEIIVTSDRAIVRWHGAGTQRGIFYGQLPAGRKMQYSGISIFKIATNKITDSWVGADVADIINQLKVYSSKQYTDADFDVDFNGPAGKIYRFIMNARPVRACKQKMANALRDIYSTVPINNEPALIIPDELFSAITRNEITINHKQSHLRALVYHPHSSSQSLPVILYIHGGGWSIGSADDVDLIARKLALKANAIVVNIDYRLAPEFPYPAGLDDCMNAYEWIREHANTLSANPNCVMVSGDSCGGNLALAITLRTRAENKRVPDAIIALCPLTDFIFEKYPATLEHGPHSLLYDLAFLNFVRSIYSPYALWQHPFVSPMYGDLTQFPPTFILAGGQDLLIDENKLFAQQLKEAGCEVELLIHEAMPHAYYYFLGLCEEEEEAYQAIGKFVRKIAKN